MPIWIKYIQGGEREREGGGKERGRERGREGGKIFIERAFELY